MRRGRSSSVPWVGTGFSPRLFSRRRSGPGGLPRWWPGVDYSGFSVTAQTSYRVLRPLSAPAKVKVMALVAIVVALTGFEVSGWIVLGLSVVLGAVTLLLLPGAAVALVVTRRIALPDLAGSDVWWIATRGRLPNVDWPVRALRPPPGPARAGARVQSRNPVDPPYPTMP